MKKIKSFIDAGALICAYRADSEVGTRAIAIIDDPARTFVTSDFIRLEVIPKATYNKRPGEVDFYEAFFGAAKCVHASKKLFLVALEEAKQYGLSAADALHVAAAKAKRCVEFLRA